MNHAEAELAKTQQLGASALSQGASDTHDLARTAVTLDETATTLRNIAADIGMTGDGADAAWTAFTAMATTLNTQADALTQAAGAGRACLGSSALSAHRPSVMRSMGH